MIHRPGIRRIKSSAQKTSTASLKQSNGLIKKGHTASGLIGAGIERTHGRFDIYAWGDSGLCVALQYSCTAFPLEAVSSYDPTLQARVVLLFYGAVYL